MKEKELRKLYYEHFQEKIKSSEKYKIKFNKAVSYEKENMKRFSKADKEVIENIVDNIANIITIIKFFLYSFV